VAARTEIDDGALRNDVDGGEAVDQRAEPRQLARAVVEQQEAHWRRQ